LSPYNQKQVIYLISRPLSSRNLERYGIKNWVHQGWKVKIFDVTSFLYPKFWRYVEENKLSVNFEGLTIFHNIKGLLCALNNLQNKVVFIDFLAFSVAEMKIRKIARTHGVLVQLSVGSIPELKNKTNILNLFSLIINPIVFVKKFIFFIKNIAKQIRVKRYFPDYFVVSGTKSMLGINDKKTSVIKAHNFDYDTFIQQDRIILNKNSNSLVFLDEAGPYHSDFIYSGIKPYVTADKYYSAIDLGLSEIAKSLKLNIIIAAHPRSNYEVKKIKYKNPILEKKTFELIRDADVVVGHNSTAFQWAIIMKKPIIIVTTDEIQNELYARNYAKYIHYFATILGKKVLNLSDLSSVNNLKDYLNVDEEKYEKYIETYIKIDGSPEKLSWDIVIENVENDLLHKKIYRSLNIEKKKN
jgi:hypothetical protein